MAGRLTPINSVTSSSLNHSFMVYKWPKNLLKKMATAIRNFLWSGKINKKNVVIVAWDKSCHPKREGGLGIQSLEATNRAFLKKMVGELWVKSA